MYALDGSTISLKANTVALTGKAESSIVAKGSAKGIIATGGPVSITGVNNVSLGNVMSSGATSTITGTSSAGNMEATAVKAAGGSTIFLDGKIGVHAHCSSRC